MTCSISVLPNVANKEAGIAQVTNINQLPQEQRLYSPFKWMRCHNMTTQPHFEGGAEYILMGEKSL